MDHGTEDDGSCISNENGSSSKPNALQIPVDPSRLSSTSISPTTTSTEVPPSPNKEATPTPSVASYNSRKTSTNFSTGLTNANIVNGRPSLSYVPARSAQNAHSSLSKFILYESRTRFCLVASNAGDSRHRILRIDRTSQDSLNVQDDNTVYTGNQMRDILKRLEEGNKSNGGLGKARIIFGLAGEIAFDRFISSRSIFFQDL